MDEGRISRLIDLLSEVVEVAGANERTSIYPNAEIINDAPTGLTNYVIVSDESGHYIPALKIPGVVYTTGDKVNLLYIKGTEPIAFQHGTSSTNVGNAKVSEIWESDFGAVAAQTDATGNLTFEQGATINLQGATGGPQSGTARSMLAKLGHILDGGHPSNPYPTTRNADDSEFNNSTQAENNTIGTHVGGDFWEWSPGAATTVNINSTVANALYVLKNAADSATDRYIKAAISPAEDETYQCEICILPFYNGWKAGYHNTLVLIDTVSGKYCRIKKNDDTTNGTQIVGSYDTGSGETTLFTHTTGPLAPMMSIGLARYISGASAFCRYFYGFGTSWIPFATAISSVSMGAKADFIPDEVRLEFSNSGGPGQSWALDSYRRVL